MILKCKNATQKLFFSIFFLAFVLIATFPVHVMAADETTNTKAEYDLRKGGTQEFAVQDDDGTIIYVTITEEPGKLRANNGTYNIKYKVPYAWEAGFKVNISSNQITSAYAPYYTLYSGQVESSRLTKESPTQASYYLAYLYAGHASKTGVRATINKTVLNVNKI